MSEEDKLWENDPRWFSAPQSTMNVSVGLPRISVDVRWFDSDPSTASKGDEDNETEPTHSESPASAPSAEPQSRRKESLHVRTHSGSSQTRSQNSESRLLQLEISSGLVVLAQAARHDSRLQACLQSPDQSANGVLASGAMRARKHASLDRSESCWTAPAMKLNAHLENISGNAIGSSGTSVKFLEASGRSGDRNQIQVFVESKESEEKDEAAVDLALPVVGAEAGL